MEDTVKIILVDDDAVIRKTVRDILMCMNIHVITASNGHEALKLASEEDFNVALIDLRMPDIDGIETFRRLKRIKPMLKAFLITSLIDEARAREATKAGISGIIEKPFKINTLVEAIGIKDENQCSNENEQ
ncbi:MAG TPA: response regulator [Candidatus Lokiarchaeia archaeon]|nr:response regulator [Candidatus Lokiarchaeia archaeon]